MYTSKNMLIQTIIVLQMLSNYSRSSSKFIASLFIVKFKHQANIFGLITTQAGQFEPELPTPLIRHNAPHWIEPEIPIQSVEEEEPLVRNIRSAKPHVYAGMSPLDIRFVKNYNEKEQSNWVSPIFSSIVYRTQVTFYNFTLFMEVV